MSIALTRDELRELSGRQKRSAIVAWLKDRRIPYILDADDWPKVLRSAILDQPAPRLQASEPRLRLA